jgi:hypothetical protein
VKKYSTYVVTLRRDVQQVAVVRVDAYSRQEAVNVAESVASDDETAWEREGCLGSYPPKVHLAPKVNRKPGRRISK